MNLIASHQLYCLSFLTVSADFPKVMTEPVKGFQTNKQHYFLACIKLSQQELMKKL